MRILAALVLVFASSLGQAANFSFDNPPGPFKVGFRVVRTGT